MFQRRAPYLSVFGLLSSDSRNCLWVHRSERCARPVHVLHGLCITRAGPLLHTYTVGGDVKAAIDPSRVTARCAAGAPAVEGCAAADGARAAGVVDAPEGAPSAAAPVDERSGTAKDGRDRSHREGLPEPPDAVVAADGGGVGGAAEAGGEDGSGAGRRREGAGRAGGASVESGEAGVRRGPGRRRRSGTGAGAGSPKPRGGVGAGSPPRPCAEAGGGAEGGGEAEAEDLDAAPVRAQRDGGRCPDLCPPYELGIWRT